MKKGFTLLELIVVIIIIGILAVLGFTQYGRVVERSRGAEARAILGDIRKFATMYYLEYGALSTSFTSTFANIGASTDQIPGTVAGNCRTSHYFFYSFTITTPGTITITATRCTSGGKTPNYGVANTLTLTSNLTSGADSWSGTFGY